MIEGSLPARNRPARVRPEERKDAKVLEDLSSYALSADGKKVL